jgi:DNA repair photolyase
MSTQALPIIEQGGICTPAAGIDKVDLWRNPFAVTKTNFHFKSLCNWVVNPCVGCAHGCPFCYVPSVSAGKQQARLAEQGVSDPALEWGEYSLVREWDESEFLRSLRAAQNTPTWKLTPAGGRVVMYSSTTDPYQMLRHGDPDRRRELQAHLSDSVRRSMELIRDHSDLGVRVQTRFARAVQDFDIYQSLGDRAVFGTSVMTMREDLRRVYEPRIAPTQNRLDMLKRAHDAGIAIYVALAPIPPECTAEDIHDVMSAIKEVDPITVFVEPINIRGKNRALVETSAKRAAVQIKTDVYGSPALMRRYALDTFRTVERVAEDVGLSHCLHLWPDADLGSGIAMREVGDPVAHLAWLNKWWDRVSEWPGLPLN